MSDPSHEIRNGGTLGISSFDEGVNFAAEKYEAELAAKDAIVEKQRAALQAIVDYDTPLPDGLLAQARAALALTQDATPLDGRRFALDEITRFILGRPSFMLAPIAHRLKKLGKADIPNKCEEEQAFVIHWLLHLYFEYGEKWDDVMMAELKESA